MLYELSAACDPTFSCFHTQCSTDSSTDAAPTASSQCWGACANRPLSQSPVIMINHPWSIFKQRFLSPARNPRHVVVDSRGCFYGSDMCSQAWQFSRIVRLLFELCSSKSHDETRSSRCSSEDLRFREKLLDWETTWPNGICLSRGLTWFFGSSKSFWARAIVIPRDALAFKGRPPLFWAWFAIVSETLKDSPLPVIAGP